MNVLTPPTASELPFTICSNIFGIPAKKSMKARSNSYPVPSVFLTTENITSNMEVIRSLMEVIIEVIIVYIRSGSSSRENGESNSSVVQVASKGMKRFGFGEAILVFIQKQILGFNDEVC